jgi:hypothetical protein
MMLPVSENHAFVEYDKPFMDVEGGIVFDANGAFYGHDVTSQIVEQKGSEREANGDSQRVVEQG